jgi:tRNA1Val (adenine37-N6)-methyltransferase
VPPATSRDSLLGGALVYEQPAEGYRVTLEAPMLAAFATPEGRRSPRVAVDLGAGPGAVGLCVAWRAKACRVTLVERDALHASLARANVVSNALDARVSVLESDVAGAEAALGRGACDLVIANPPWFDVAAGASPVDPRRAASRLLDRSSLRPFVSAARQLLGRGGRMAIAFPASAIGWLWEDLAACGLVAKRMRAIHPRASAPANAVLIEAQAGRPGGLVIEPPWMVRGEGEAYTDEVRAILWPT